VTNQLLTARQVGEWLGLSPAAVLRRWRAGEIPGYRLGSNVLRFQRSDVDAFLAERYAARDMQAAGHRANGPGPTREANPMQSESTDAC
jgi:excisionase family DNA binding protein